MAIPVASFLFTANALVLTFKDFSTNVPTSWAWDFGDGNNSAVQNPSNTYAAAGLYIAKLTATNADGSNLFQIAIWVSAEPRLSLTISEMVYMEIPGGITFDPVYMNQSTRRWQLHLQTLLPAEDAVSDADVFDESKWPTLVNALIAKLIVRDLILKAAESAMVASANAAGTYSSQSGSTPGIGKGPLKSIETGPSKAEWYDSSSFWKTMMGGYSSTGASSGIFQMIQDECCVLARRVKIRLPFCPQVRDTKIFIVGRKTCND